jgi:BlaI family transcriptional regulator, penicillinase repressor
MARPPSKQPTDGELEILKILWELGPAGLGQVHSALHDQRPVALTTVATMLKMMLAKGLVSRRDGDHGYEWSAGVSRNVAVSGLIGKLVQHVFDGSARRLVAHLIQEGDLGDAERAEILELLKKSAVEDSASPKPKRKEGGR